MRAGQAGCHGKSSLVVLVLGIAALLLSACGGGGGGSSPPPANLASAPGLAAMSAYYQGTHSVTLSASYGGSTYTAHDTLTPNAQTAFIFGFGPYPNSTEVLTILKDGNPFSSATTTQFYYVTPVFSFAGALGNVPGSYVYPNQSQGIHTTINVGDSGPLFTGTLYHDQTTMTADATETISYSVLPDSPTALDFCTIAVITPTAPNPDMLTNTSQTNCYRIDATGNVTFFKATVVIGGLTLTFQ